MFSNSAMINIRDARKNLSKLLARASAGEEIVICKAGAPYARLTAVAPQKQRKLGFLSHLFTEDELNAIDRALDTPMAESDLKLWYGEAVPKVLQLADGEGQISDGSL